MKIRVAFSHEMLYYYRQKGGSQMADEKNRIQKAAEAGIVGFWVVTLPNEDSELGDICFPSDIEGLANLIRCGLQASRIIGLYASEEDAKIVAGNLLKAFENAYEEERYFRMAAQQ
jgi:hypothetical protein